MVSATGPSTHGAWLNLVRSRTAAWMTSWRQRAKTCPGAIGIEASTRHVRAIDLVRFMQLARLRYSNLPYIDADPLPAILRRLASSAEAPGNLALRKTCLAVLASEGTLTSAELWLLDEEAVALLDRLTDWHRSGCYGAGVLRAAISLLSEA